MLEVKNVSNIANITFMPSPVDIWRRLQRNVSHSSGGDAVFDTFIPLFVDENILGTSFSSEIPGFDSNEESSSTVDGFPDNYDDVHSREDGQDSSVDSQELQQVMETDTGENSSNLQEKDGELKSSKIAGYLGVDVSEDVFYLLEK